MAESNTYKCQASWKEKEGWLFNSYVDDPKEAIDLIKQMKAELDPEEEAPQEAPQEPVKDDLYDGAIPQCPTHKIDMVKRNGRYGSFFGCPKYPDCKQVIK